MEFNCCKGDIRVQFHGGGAIRVQFTMQASHPGSINDARVQRFRQPFTPLF